MEIKIRVKGCKMKPIHEFENFQGNLKKLSKEAKEKLIESIKQNGFNAPIFLWAGKNYILDGHQRIEAINALIREGHTLESKDMLPYVEIEAESEQQAAEMILTYNSQYGEITKEGLTDFFKDFEINQMELKDMTNFLNLGKLNNLFDVYDENEGEDDMPETPKEAKSKTGELWILGKHRLLCGDSSKKENMERLTNNQKVDLIFTDPPYNVDYRGSKDKPRKELQNDNLPSNEFKEWLANIFLIMQSQSKETAPAFICSASSSIDQFMWAIKQVGYNLSNTIIWKKDRPTFRVGKWQCYKWGYEPILLATNSQPPNSYHELGTSNNVWEVAAPISFGNRENNDEHIGATGLHPTMKPIKLCLIPINNHTKENEIVLDPFLGSGSTLIACEKSDRVCYGMEIEPIYCDVILERWANFTGQDPVREDGKKWSELKKESEAKN